MTMKPSASESYLGSIKPRSLKRSKTSLCLGKKLGLTLDVAAVNGEDADPSEPMIIPHTNNLYLTKNNPLLKRHSFYSRGKLFNEEFSIQEDGLTIKTLPSSCSLLSGSSEEEAIPLSPPLVDIRNSWHEMKISKKEVIKGKLIGGGASSAVFMGKIKSTGRMVALKKINRATICPTTTQVFNEIKVLSNLTNDGYEAHPCIVGFHGAFLDEEAVVVCLEYMNAGSLQDALNRLSNIPETPLGGMLYQALNGLSYLHNVRNIVHRDIKPGNIVMNKEGQVKLADFGLSTTVTSKRNRCQTFIGTFKFMSPERLKGGSYAHPADIWAIGIVATIGATGQYPFSSTARFELICEVCDLESKPILPSMNGETKFSKSFRNFISDTLIKDSRKRITAEEAICHDWFQSLAISSLSDSIKLTKGLVSGEPIV